MYICTYISPLWFPMGPISAHRSSLSNLPKKAELLKYFVG